MSINYDQYVVFDIETTVKNKGDMAIGNNKAAPFHPDNRALYIGWKTGIMDNVKCNGIPDLQSWSPHKTFLLVGHNIRFDLHYLKKTFPHVDYNYYNIWDTQLAEYILLGQMDLYPALNEVATRYGGTTKYDVVKDMIEGGVEVEDIPEEELLKYLTGDVENTEKVSLGQLERAKRNGMLPLIESQMKALKATWNMESNGMAFDKNYANLQIEELEIEEKTYTSHIASAMADVFPIDVHDQLNPNSNDHLSLLLFGGKYMFTVKRTKLDADGNIVYYKSGAKKGFPVLRNVKEVFEIEGLNIPAQASWLNAKGLYQTNDEVLQQISKMKLNSYAKEVVTTILELRRVRKDLGTYFKGYSELVWPDGMIHGNINHCATATGRLSSTGPNLQNLSGKDT